MPANKRAPARPKKIDEIDPRQDIRVRINATVIEKGNDSVVVDDGSGKTEVFLDNEVIEGLEEKKMVRIIGRVLPTPDSFEVQGEIVQSLKDVDMELYEKVMEIA